MKRTNNKQPAKKSYFFGQGYIDMFAAIKKLWILNAQTAQGYNDRYNDYGLMKIKGVFWFVCAISVVVFGTIFFAIFSIAFLIVLISFFILIYIGFSIVWLCDRAYLYRNKIFTACNECKEKSLIPTYICPNCGAKHTNLTPGAYGILKRKCSCGEKLPTSFVNNRRNLQAICPHCSSQLSDRESVPICIPIVGGRSVGKTAFITAFSKGFIEKIAPAKGWDIEFYNEAKSDIYKEISQDYLSGSTRMTDRPQDINKTSSVSFSFFVKGKEFKPERLVHVYDIAGEVFTDNSENEVQKQYEYCQGMVLMIDPFSIPSVRYRYEKNLSPEDVAGIGKADINGIINNFINKLRDVTGLTDRKMLRVPLAIVLSKTDSAELYDEFSKNKLDELLLSSPDIHFNDYDAQDYLCREFLKENGMESFLNVVNIKFKNNRYFVCSAIGHTRDAGEYNPKGVLEPMEWLFGKADYKIKKVSQDTELTKEPISKLMTTI